MDIWVLKTTKAMQSLIYELHNTIHYVKNYMCDMTYHQLKYVHCCYSLKPLNLVFMFIVLTKCTWFTVVPPVLEQQTPSQFISPQNLLPSVEQLLSALHTRHGVHVLTPVCHFLFLRGEKMIFNHFLWQPHSYFFCIFETNETFFKLSQFTFCVL